MAHDAEAQPLARGYTRAGLFLMNCMDIDDETEARVRERELGSESASATEVVLTSPRHEGRPPATKNCK